MWDVVDNLEMIDLWAPINPDHPANKDLRGWWVTVPGLDGGRQIYDLTKQAHGTLMNGLGWGSSTRPGALGGGALYSPIGSGGVTAYVAITLGATIVPPLSFSFWMTQDRFGGDPVNFGLPCFFSVCDCALLSNTATNFIWQRQGGSFESCSAATATRTLGRWYHVVVTVAGTSAGDVKFYLDGQPQSDNGVAVSNAASAAVKLLTASGHTATGRFDDFRLYGRVLDAITVWSLYDLSRRGYPGVLNRVSSVLYSIPAAGGGGGFSSWWAGQRGGMLGTGMVA